MNLRIESTAIVEIVILVTICCASGYKKYVISITDNPLEALVYYAW